MQFAPLMLLALSGVLLGIPTGVQGTFKLEPLSHLYIPYDYDGDDGIYGIDEAAVEQSAYDKDAKILYAAGYSYMHIVDMADLSNPRIMARVNLDTGRANDIELCGDYVAYVVEGKTSQDNGYLVVMGKYDTLTKSWQKFNTIEIGVKPDMLEFSHDCSFIVTANEGEADERGPIFVNPEGSVSIVRNFADSIPSTTTIDFTGFNYNAAYYESIGVRAPYKGQMKDDVPNTFSQNMEPEYIALSSDDTIAYICLQENNAIAVVDLATDTITGLLPFGRKDWSNLDIDASDKDGKIATKKFDIFSLYQPDAIKLYRQNGVDYILTANEGDKFAFELNGDKWDETKRGNDLHDDGDLSKKMSVQLDDDMNNKIRLGRLQFSKNDGLDSDGKILEPTFFGGRGVSVFRPDVDAMKLVWDSADEVERVIAQYYPSTFNSDTKPSEWKEESPKDLKDSRSALLGPECESIEIGTINGQDFAFFGVDRSAVILMYRIGSGADGPELAFESVYRGGGRGDTFHDLLDERNLGDLDPEDLKFVAASDSPNGNPLLIVTSTVSGTIGVYQIIDN